MGAMALAFSSCESFDLPNPPGQSNPQEPVFEAANLNILSAAGDQTYDLGQLNTVQGTVKLADLESVSNLPENYTELKFIGQMAASDAFNNPVDFPVTYKDNAIYADADALDGAYHPALNTIAPDAKTVNIRFKAYAVNPTDETTMRLGGKDAYYCPMTASLKPFDPGFTIEDKYYLIGTCSDGQINAQAIEMTNSGASPYDDPNFSVVVDITAAEAAAGYEWAVVPASTLAAGTGVVYGPEYDDNLYAASGNFKAYETVGVFGVIEEENKHLITVNMRPDENGLHAYTWILAIPNLWTPGNSNGWSHDKSQMLYTNNYIDYSGFVNVVGEFKFTSAPDWDHTNYGYAGDGKLSTDGGAGNIKVTQDGLYWVTANISALTYTISPCITTFGLIGDATEGGWDASTPLTPSEDFLTWTGTVTLKGEGSFKFRANDSWDVVNLGGETEFLSTDGGAPNIATPGEGTYDVTLSLGAYPYTATLVKK